MKTHPWSMPSRPKCTLEEEEVKVEETREEEAEARIEVEGTTLHIHMEGATVRIKAMANATANEVDISKVDINTNMLMEKGMKNPMSNVIIAKNMGTMPMNVERIKMT